MVASDHHQKAYKPHTPPESQPRIGLTGDSHFQTCFFSDPAPTVRIRDGSESESENSEF